LHALWLEGRKPKDITLLIFATLKRKSWKVNKALEDNAWAQKINLDESFALEHLSQLLELWAKLQGVHLNEEVEDDISWKLTAIGKYLAKSSYELQFLGSTTSFLYNTVWKVGLLLRQSSLHGFSHKIESGPRIIYKSMVGQIVVAALFASKSRNRCAISSCIAATPYTFGTTLGIGWAFPESFQANGRTSPPRCGVIS
jgi:hypothetical protein